MNWVSVKDRLPEMDKLVLLTDGKTVFPGWLARGDMMGVNREGEKLWAWSWAVPGGQDDGDPLPKHPEGVYVTHWMPLPEPPKEADNDHTD